MVGIGSIIEWSIVQEKIDGPRMPFITGRIFGHPRFEDGVTIFTNTIISATGRNIVTASGSCYVLSGNPCIQWMIYCLKKGKKIDIDNPFPNLGYKLGSTDL